MEENNIKIKIAESRFFVVLAPVLVLLFSYFFISHADGANSLILIIPIILGIISLFDILRNKKGITFGFIAVVGFTFLYIIVNLTN